MTTQTKVEAVAEIGPVWTLLWAGTDTVAQIVNKHGLRIGDKLYPQSALDALRGEVAEQSAWADKWKALHDAVSLAHDVQTKSIVRAFARADAAERRAAELEAALSECNALSAARLMKILELQS